MVVSLGCKRFYAKLVRLVQSVPLWSMGLKDHAGPPTLLEIPLLGLLLGEVEVPVCQSCKSCYWVSGLDIES